MDIFHVFDLRFDFDHPFFDKYNNIHKRSANILVTHCFSPIWPLPHKAGWNLKHKVYSVLF